MQRSTRHETILVPLDGSKFAECALPIALGVARRMDGQVGLVSVSSKKRRSPTRRVPTISPNDVNLIDEAAANYLNGVAARIAEFSSVPVFPTVLTGKPSTALVKHAKRHHPELLVMSTHGRGPLSRSWLGSVVDSVVRHVPMPVLLVRPESNCEVELDDAHQFRRIVVPLDGSGLAEQSLQWAISFGGSEAHYSLVRVTPDSIPAWSPLLQIDTQDVRDLVKAAHDESSEYLSAVKRTVERDGLTVKTRIEDTMPSAVGILEAAKEESADLIVITTHGRGGLRRLVWGSVADKVVRASHVPVLVVHPARG